MLFLSACHLFEKTAQTEYDQSWEFDNSPNARKTNDKTSDIAQNSSKKPKKKKKKNEPQKNTQIATKEAETPIKPKTPNASSNSVKKYQEKWKVNIPDQANIQLLQAIDSWIGTPYKYGGRTKSGTDCSGFALNIYSEVYKIDIERSTNDILGQSKAIKKGELKEGDFVFFKINSSRANHVGIYLGNQYFAHASTSRGVMISSLNEAYWTKYWFTGGRILNQNKLQTSGL